MLKSEYIQPGFEEKKFHCFKCGVLAHHRWYPAAAANPSYNSFEGTGVDLAYCDHCGFRSVWYQEELVFPSKTPVEPAHPDLPDDCRQEYEEAAKVFTDSPRAAAALLRLCIQKLMPHLGEKGENINTDIKSLVANGLPVLIQKALDFCRVVGNNAVHPGEIDLNDSPEIALSLFRMINIIVDERISRPREIEALYAALPTSSLDAIAKRDGTP